MKMGKAAMKILGLKDEEFYEVRKLSQFWKIETTVVQLSSMLTVSFLHGIVMQGMGKYFVLLAREAGYERTLLQLGRRIR